MCDSLLLSVQPSKDRSSLHPQKEKSSKSAQSRLKRRSGLTNQEHSGGSHIFPPDTHSSSKAHDLPQGGHSEEHFQHHWAAQGTTGLFLAQH